MQEHNIHVQILFRCSCQIYIMSQTIKYDQCCESLHLLDVTVSKFSKRMHHILKVHMAKSQPYQTSQLGT